MRGAASFKHRQQLMLRAVETAHAGVRFCPDNQIERCQPQGRCAIALTWFIGIKAFLLVHLPITLLAATAGRNCLR
jgi:hypothetical protein